ncbi:MAG TPA: UDP-N-acetylmuramate--L-alanine ligase [Vitreimonas sp.]|nr:UDP-N-acetylmuramate--L-alanine ligase [Vitreimonas sp.]
MMQILEYHHFYLVGIKGVAMASLAQCLLDAGKSVRGCDVSEKFVTQSLLEKRSVHIDIGFEGNIPAETECVIYTAAHKGKFNPIVQAAQAQSIPTFSQAEAMASLFNQKQGVAVCGVGGKSTTSAMITWILEKTGRQPSFSVGVGNIPGLDKTGQWQSDSQYFIAEADEYVIDPSAPSRGEEITPRFSFMNPWLTICTNLRFDHPDVYKDFEHTKTVFKRFFEQIKDGGVLVVNSDDQELLHLAKEVAAARNIQVVSYGEDIHSLVTFRNITAHAGKTIAGFLSGEMYSLELQIPGKYNVYNALAALTACKVMGVEFDEGIAALASFRSTLRRAEFIGEKNGVKFYDDYAHHPNEVKSVIHAFKEWFPDSKLMVAFQSHTFSRTKALFPEFIDAFAEADEVAMIDIFPSAREPYDASITSEMLCEEIEKEFVGKSARNYKTLANLAKYLQHSLKPGDVCLTVGAGDIYKVHELLT